LGGSLYFDFSEGTVCDYLQRVEAAGIRWESQRDSVGRILWIVRIGRAQELRVVPFPSEYFKQDIQ
jgi:hypothetical protein